MLLLVTHACVCVHVSIAHTLAMNAHAHTQNVCEHIKHTCVPRDDDERRVCARMFFEG